jgi:hypothetical protein
VAGDRKLLQDEVVDEPLSEIFEHHARESHDYGSDRLQQAADSAVLLNPSPLLPLPPSPTRGEGEPESGEP